MGPPQSAFSQQQQQQQRPNLYNQQQQVQAPINSNIPYSNMADTRPGLFVVVFFLLLGRKKSTLNVQQLKLRERKIFFFRLISVR